MSSAEWRPFCLCLSVLNQVGISSSFQWHHNEHPGVSNHQRLECLKPFPFDDVIMPTQLIDGWGWAGASAVGHELQPGCRYCKHATIGPGGSPPSIVNFQLTQWRFMATMPVRNWKKYLRGHNLPSEMSKQWNMNSTYEGWILLTVNQCLPHLNNAQLIINDGRWWKAHTPIHMLPSVGFKVRQYWFRR